MCIGNRLAARISGHLSERDFFASSCVAESCGGFGSQIVRSVTRLVGREVSRLVGPLLKYFSCLVGWMVSGLKLLLFSLG